MIAETTGKSQTAQENPSGTIFCFFKTNLAAEYKLDETQHNISTSLNEKTLNEILAQLLAGEHDDEEESKYTSKNFEFLINGEFLRGTLRSHILKHDLISEETIEIWYTFSLSAPQEQSRAQEEDWISAISLLRSFHTSKLSPVVASLYNGSISVYNESLEHQFRHQLTDASIKAVAVQQNYLSGSSASDYLVYSACDDETLRVGRLTYEAAKGKKVNVEYSEFADLLGSTSKLQCLDVNILRGDLVCAGNYAGDIFVYSLTQKNIDESSSAGGETAVGKKRVKLNKKVIDPITTVNGRHSDRISGIYWKDSDRILTSSHDHHIKLYDTTKQAEVQDILSKDSAITAMFPTQGLILSGHEDNLVKAWDLRERGPVKTFKSHSSWVSCIRGLETDENVFLTTSYDHSVKIWDMRSSFPVFTLKTHHDKVLAATWNSNASIVTGGSDNEIVAHAFKAD